MVSKVKKMILVTFVHFLFCNILQVLNTTLQNNIIEAIADLFITIYASTNGFIYAIGSAQFRQSLKLCYSCQRRPLPHCPRTLWLETRNLNHLPFGMILNLDIGLLHPSRLPRHKISQKKWKRPKKIFEGHNKRPDWKKWFFIIFLP